jgi:hypothetical protein
MATDSLSGEPEIMASFKPVGPQVSSRTVGSAGGAAMAEAQAFFQADGDAARALQDFVGQVNQGFSAYSDAAAQAAETYLSLDKASADLISKSPLALNAAPVINFVPPMGPF